MLTLSDVDDAGLGQYRNYLRVLARQALGPELQGKIDDSDLAQDTLMQVCRRRDQFRGKTEPELLAYLRRILANKVIDAQRRFGTRKRNVARERSLEGMLDHSSMRLGNVLAGSKSSASEKAARSEQLLRVAASLDALPSKQRQAIELHYLQERTFSKVASAMGLNRDQVAGLIRRGVAKLRETLS